MIDKEISEEGSIIFEWELPENYPNFSGHDDLPKAYRVIESEKCAGGIIIYARWKGGWEANPWNTRTLVRKLLELLKQPNQSIQPTDE